MAVRWLFRRFPNESGIDDRLSDEGGVGGFSRDTPQVVSVLGMGWARSAMWISPVVPPQSVFVSGDSSLFKASTIAGRVWMTKDFASCNDRSPVRSMVSDRCE